MTTAPFIPPRLNLVKNENSMPTGPQPFVVELKGLYKIENGKLVGKLEELKRTQEVMPHQVCQVNNSHFKINLIFPYMVTINDGNRNGTNWSSDYNGSYFSWLGGAPTTPTGVGNGMMVTQSVFTVEPIGINVNGVRAGNMAFVPMPVDVVGNVSRGGYVFDPSAPRAGYRTVTF